MKETRWEFAEVTPDNIIKHLEGVCLRIIDEGGSIAKLYASNRTISIYYMAVFRIKGTGPEKCAYMGVKLIPDETLKLNEVIVKYVPKK